MQVRINLFFIFLILALSVNAQEVFTPPVKPNTAFRVGENLSYQIRYGLVLGGIATISLTDEIYNNKKAFHAVATAQTTGMAELIFGVKDSYESWFDKKTNLSYKQIRNIREGRYRKYNEVTYNRENNTVNSKLSGVHPVPENILDLTTTLYYIRRIDFSKVKEGDTVFLNMYFADEIFPFYLRYKGKESIRTKFGKISCLKISPVVEVGRMFKTPDDLSIWLTDDANQLPVLVKTDIRHVGSVLLKLTKYENISNPLIIQQ
ncbi:MAG: hypothetical protein A2W90_09845 [Bacteroidetes bacterium GWF2_42_66]|nr:MAG: hypothetical protein A2W92_05155 [Bacteroidetes bacterium GWA2_42_15]OFX97534.1 MAG: hypothetical protein A2W89_01560 [Bacteroidetes bacterium GWE2_42_39]OFY43771.1 MAG: hypothetical protein A2W90_09845 [Bacteroidetes bacterium GWF2_42_66]HAZ04732.1 hypothetical protein [Marinilabiliales bacterium]HBL76252.1 hypothetical protein [Prolixibacteraceae bacterium]